MLYTETRIIRLGIFYCMLHYIFPAYLNIICKFIRFEHTYDASVVSVNPFPQFQGSHLTAQNKTTKRNRPIFAYDKLISVRTYKCEKIS